MKFSNGGSCRNWGPIFKFNIDNVLVKKESNISQINKRTKNKYTDLILFIKLADIIL